MRRKEAAVTLGERLRLVRNQLGESQKSMATRFGLGQNTWQRYENSNVPPKGETLAQLAELGFSINWILAGQGGSAEPVVLDSDDASVGAANTAEVNPLEMDLLRNIVQGLEEALDNLGLELTPDKKGRAVSLIYKYYSLRGDQKKPKDLHYLKEVIEALSA